MREEDKLGRAEAGATRSPTERKREKTPSFGLSDKRTRLNIKGSNNKTRLNKRKIRFRCRHDVVCVVAKGPREPPNPLYLSLYVLA